MGCIDHHVDEHSVPKNTGEEPRVIDVAGSCTSLVINHFSALLSSLPNDEADGEIEIVDEEDLAWLALAPILIDTQCLENANKVTAHDIKAAELLESILAASSTLYNRAVYHQEIYDAKQDISHLSIQDILRKDYKLWIENGMNIGIACSVQPLSFLISKAGSFDRLIEELERFSEERELGLSAIMTAFTPENGEFARELLVLGRTEQGKDALKGFEKDSVAVLRLEEMGLGEGCKREGLLKVWRQKSVECSRKQVAPLLRKAAL